MYPFNHPSVYTEAAWTRHGDPQPYLGHISDIRCCTKDVQATTGLERERDQIGLPAPTGIDVSSNPTDST